MPPESDAEAQAPLPGTSTTGVWAGARVGAGLAAGSFVLAITFGASSQQADWGPLAPVVASMVIFSGSAQFALLAGLVTGGAPWAAVVSAGLINLRFLPMALAASSALRGGRLRRAVEAQLVVDGSWVAAHRGGSRFDRDVLMGATLVQWPAWVVGTAIGVLFAPPKNLESAFGLDVVFPAFFALLILEELRSAHRLPRARTVGVLSGGITALLLLILPASLALLAGSSAALLGLKSLQVPAVIDREKQPPKQDRT